MMELSRFCCNLSKDFGESWQSKSLDGRKMQLRNEEKENEEVSSSSSSSSSSERNHLWIWATAIHHLCACLAHNWIWWQEHPLQQQLNSVGNLKIWRDSLCLKMEILLSLGGREECGFGVYDNTFCFLLSVFFSTCGTKSNISCNSVFSCSRQQQTRKN